MTQEIEKPWCTYRDVDIIGYGKITWENEKKTSGNILYCEGQTYPSRAWDFNYVDRFNTLEEAVKDYNEKRPKRFAQGESAPTDDEVRFEARKSFPSYFKGKKKTATSN